jgi:agmatine deiminase
MLGVKKIIWLPTGVTEDQGTFRGRIAPHIYVPRFDGVDIPHSGVYTLFTTNGHADEFVRFVTPDTIVLAEQRVSGNVVRTPAEALVRWLEEENRDRLEGVYDILSRQTTESGAPIRIVRIPVPELTLEVFKPGDGIYDYYAAYDRWEDGSTLPEVMLGVWPASYVNYVPSNDLLLIPKFWKPGRPLRMLERDAEAREILADLFPGREVNQINADNVIRGGGGMNCITQQMPAGSTFAQMCGWSKVKVGVEVTTLFAGSTGNNVMGEVPRLSRSGGDVYLRRLSTQGGRVRVRIEGAVRLDGEVGWVDEDDIEAAGEKCSSVYSLN